MLNSKSIINALEKEGFEEVDEIKYKDGILVYNFFYQFDEAETEAAKSYANDNYEEEKGEDEWYDEYFLPYLSEVAGDNVRDVLEDICEEINASSEFVAFEMDRDSYDHMEFVAVIAEEGVEFDMDEILGELEF